MRKSSLTLTLAVFILLTISSSNAQEDPAGALLARINQVRLDEGLIPYDRANLLNIAAQRHADDVAATGFTNPDDVHAGSDGSTAQQRIQEAGYAAWRWLGGETITGENMWTGQGTIEDALAFFLESPPHRNNLLSTSYREIGIGIASDEDGRNYYVLTFGARPNVLPIFINEGAPSTDNPQVAILLTNEEARPDGEGASFMGQAIEIRINSEPSWENLPWQPWDSLVPWTLPETPGQHTVYVQFRDAADRRAASTDSILLEQGAGEEDLPSPMPEPSATPVPPTATPVPPTPTPVPPTAAPVPPTATPPPVVPPTSVPTLVSPPATAPPDAPQPTAPIESSSSTGTPFPTWTPLPEPTTEEEGDAGTPLGLLATLQGLACVLGVFLLLRRRQP